MIDFIKDNNEWLVPIIIAVIGGIFTLGKKNGGNRQTIKNVKNSNIIQTGDNSIINNKE